MDTRQKGRSLLFLKIDEAPQNRSWPGGYRYIAQQSLRVLLLGMWKYDLQRQCQPVNRVFMTGKKQDLVSILYQSSEMLARTMLQYILSVKTHLHLFVF